ncbi:unnamed protein product [Mytilus edulis]|uniref:Uncharacterized protein n=1 Tax=Mytilus edulis TaxID=6550 RepID=A0A8S3QLR0_MYTED|nr:unnamed protein product [Mytilus edulis]
MKDIMVYLANAEKYEEYIEYIHDPTVFAKSWITKLTNDIMFERKGNVETKYAHLAKCRVHKIFCHLLESIQEANENCSQLGQSNVKHWIENFMNHVGNLIIYHCQLTFLFMSEVERFQISEISPKCITTEKTYKWHENDEKEEWKYYKDYKESHKDWDILPSSDVSKYWMWVVCKYQQNFQMYGFKLPDIPAHWWSITKETAIKYIKHLLNWIQFE